MNYDDPNVFAEGPCEDCVCQWCKHLGPRGVSYGDCRKYSDPPGEVLFHSAPCPGFEDNSSGKSFSRDALVEDLPKDPQIRERLIAQLRKDFGHAVAVVGNQVFHLGRMGVYAANVFPKGYVSPVGLEAPEEYETSKEICSGDLGGKILDEICNASPILRDAWNGRKRPELRGVISPFKLEEFKLLPFICYTPSQVVPRKNGVALGRKFGSRTHWALLTPSGYTVRAKYIGSTENNG